MIELGGAGLPEWKTKGENRDEKSRDESANSERNRRRDALESTSRKRNDSGSRKIYRSVAM